MLDELIDHINESMSAIQSLQIQPTESNCKKIISAIGALRKAAEIAVKMNKALEEANAENETVEEIVMEPPEESAESDSVD